MTSQEDAENVRYRAHAQANREYQQANPGFDPWAPGPEPEHEQWVADRVQCLTATPNTDSP